MATVAEGVIIAVISGSASIFIAWGKFTEKLTRLRTDHEKFQEFTIGELRRQETKVAEELAKLVARMDVVTELRVMQGQLDRTLEALHKRQDRFEETVQRVDRRLAEVSAQPGRPRSAYESQPPATKKRED